MEDVVASWEDCNKIWHVFFFFLFFLFFLPITDLVFKDNEIFDEKAYAELLAYMQAMHGNMSEIQEAHRVTQKGQQTSFEEC